MGETRTFKRKWIAIAAVPLFVGLFTFTVPWPMTGQLKTNFAGAAAVVGTFNGDMLHIEPPGQPKDKRMTFVSARNEKGEPIRVWGGSWGQHVFRKDLQSNPAGSVTAMIAIHPNYPIRFTVQPEYRASETAISSMSSH